MTENTAPRLGEGYVNLVGAAALVGVGPSTIRYWVINGKLPAERVGQRWRIKATDVYAADEANRADTRAGKRGPRGRLVREAQSG